MTYSSHQQEMRDAARHVGRRRFLTVTGAAAALAFSVNLPAAGAASAAEMDARRIGEDPFTLGVASGDPLPDSVLLWTRLAPRPYEPDSGLPNARVQVRWELARDEHFTRIVRRGTATAHPEFDHSVHVEIKGLDADRVLLLPLPRREVGQPGRPDPHRPRPARPQQRAVPRRRLLPGVPRRLLHRVQPPRAGGRRRRLPPRRLPLRVRRDRDRRRPQLHGPHTPRPLQPGDGHPGGLPAAVRPLQVRPGSARRARRAPLRRHLGRPRDREQLRGRHPRRTTSRPRSSCCAAPPRTARTGRTSRCARPQRPTGPDMQLYRRLQFGRLAQFDILDTRQYRSDQAYGDGWQKPGPESEDPSRTLTGATQERWLLDGWQRLAGHLERRTAAGHLLPAARRADRRLQAVHGRLGRLPGLPGPDPEGR